MQMEQLQVEMLEEVEVTNPNPGYILSDEILSNKINHPKHNISYPHKPSGSLNDLDLFTKGQPISLYLSLIHI